MNATDGNREVTTNLFTVDPWPHQRESIEKAIHALSNGTDSLCLTSPTGCHAKGQGILMHSGHIKAVEEVQVGDELMGPDSKPRQVLSLACGTGRLYEIKPTKGNPWIVNEDHILTLVRTRDKSRFAGMTRDISLSTWLDWNRTKKHVHKLFRVSVEFSLQSPKGQRYLSLYEEPVLDPYLLGVVLGDGSLTNGSVSVTTADEEIREYVEQVAEFHGLTLRSEPAGGKSRTYRLAGQRKRTNPVHKMFKRYGLADHTSGSKFIPHDFKVGTRKDRLLVLAGLLDTDGSLQRGTYDYISKSRQLSKDVAFVARSVGLAAYVTECEKRDQHGNGGTYWRVCISGECSIVPCRLPHKQAGKRLQKKNVLRTGFTTRFLRWGEYWGFTLDGDGRYLLDDFTVTHNSGKTQCMVALTNWALAEQKKVVLFTNRILLTEQTRRVFRDAGVHVGVVSASMPHYEFEDAPVQIATMQTILARRRANDSYWLDADLVLCDEVHQQSSGESAALLNEYKDRGAKVCGITATPLGVSNVCDKLVVAGRTRDLQDAKILCFARWFAPSELDTRKLVKGKVDLSLSENDARKTWGPLKGREKQTEVRTHIVGNILEHYQRLHPTQTHTIAFAPGVKESLWAAQFCHGRGIRALHIDGQDFWCDGQVYDRKFHDAEFRGFMDEWRAGDIPIIWNRFVLREGIDEPQIKCIMLATPVGSYRSFLQMVGRGLRIHESKSECTVLDFGGCWWRHGSVNVNVDWEDVFECDDPDVLSKNRIAKLRETGESVGRACPKCGMVHKSVGRMINCQYCGHEMFRGKPSRPILQADGTLTEVNGEPIKQWKIKAMPSNEKKWAGLYFNARKNGKDVTFNQLYSQFGYATAVDAGSRERPAFWRTYYPPRNLPMMPRMVNYWHRKVTEVARGDLY